MKSILILLASVFFSSSLIAQDCSVALEAIKGNYTGDCKKGKANGNGKAIGTDIYEGEFKNGLPDGKGTYTWSNGNSFKGNFVKGLKEGQGIFNLKRQGASDSVITGFWRKDAYAGRFEKPYTIISKGRTFGEVNIKYQKEAFNQISFFITGTSGGVSTGDGTENIPLLAIDEIELVTGSYGKELVNDTHGKKTETILSAVVFPIRMRVVISKEQIELEFREPGNYTVDIHMNQ